MNDLTLRNVDGRVVAELRRRAEKTGRSVEQEAASLLRLGVSLSLDRLDAIEQARQIRAMTPKGVTQTPAVQLIREDRDRDDCDGRRSAA